MRTYTRLATVATVILMTVIPVSVNAALSTTLTNGNFDDEVVAGPGSPGIQSWLGGTDSGSVLLYTDNGVVWGVPRTSGDNLVRMVHEAGGTAPFSMWIYQSLGTVVAEDVGKFLTIRADADQTSNTHYGTDNEGRVSFRTGTTSGSLGTILGTADSHVLDHDNAISSPSDTVGPGFFPVSVSDIGKEVFAVIQTYCPTRTEQSQIYIDTAIVQDESLSTTLTNGNFDDEVVAGPGSPGIQSWLGGTDSGTALFYTDNGDVWGVPRTSGDNLIRMVHADSGTAPLSLWIYQSIGVVAPGDVGKFLTLRVDGNQNAAPYYATDNEGIVSFRTGTTGSSLGTLLGTAGSRALPHDGAIHAHADTVDPGFFPVSESDVGKEVFAVIQTYCPTRSAQSQIYMDTAIMEEASISTVLVNGSFDDQILNPNDHLEGIQSWGAGTDSGALLSYTDHAASWGVPNTSGANLVRVGHAAGGTAPLSVWLLQPIGIVGPGDVGKYLRLMVDANQDASYYSDDNACIVSFRTGTTGSSLGTLLGTSASRVLPHDAALHSPADTVGPASVTLTAGDVGKRVLAVIQGYCPTRTAQSFFYLDTAYLIPPPNGTVVIIH